MGIGHGNNNSEIKHKNEWWFDENTVARHVVHEHGKHEHVKPKSFHKEEKNNHIV